MTTPKDQAWLVVDLQPEWSARNGLFADSCVIVVRGPCPGHRSVLVGKVMMLFSA